MLGTNQPPFIHRRPRRYDAMGILAVVCFSLAAAIILLIIVTSSHARQETPISCKMIWCDARGHCEKACAIG